MLTLQEAFTLVSNAAVCSLPDNASKEDFTRMESAQAAVRRAVGAHAALVEALALMLEAFPAPRIRTVNGFNGNLAHAAARKALALAEAEGQ